MRTISQIAGPRLVGLGNRAIALACLAMAGPTVVGVERRAVAGVARGWFAVQGTNIGHQVPALLLDQRLPPGRHNQRTMKSSTTKTNGIKELLIGAGRHVDIIG